MHRFGHVLNITKEVNQCSVLADDVTFHRFAIFDFGGDKQQQAMYGFFPAACGLIEQGMASRHPVLVHCVEGKQRSCAVVAAYLIHALAMTSSQAKAFLLDKRPEAFDGGGRMTFAPALEQWVSTVRSASATASATQGEEPARSASSGSKGANSKNKTVPPKNAPRKR